MKKRITEYRKRVDRLLADEEEKTYEEWECILEEHLVQIGFFQHERLIHLIVTVTFAVITVLSLFAPLLTGIMKLYGFTMLLLVLLVPYIFHYYIPSFCERHRCGYETRVLPLFIVFKVSSLLLLSCYKTDTLQNTWR